MQERKVYIDAVAGIMILWMVLGHLQQVTGLSLDYPNILFFFMPWFYYKAGALSKEKTLRETVSIGYGKFAKPFVIYGLIGQLILIACMLMEHETSLKPYLYSPIRTLLLGGTFPGNPPLWFLPSLFMTQCLFAYLREKKINLYLCALIGLAGGLLLMLINYAFVPVYIGSGILGIFYFAMGKMLHSYEGNWKALVVAVIMCVALLLINHAPNAEMRYISQYSGNALDYIQGVGVAICGCFIINAVLSYLQPILKFPLLRWVGRNAMDFYVWHWIILLIVHRLLMGNIFHVWDPKWQFIVSGLSCAIVISMIIILSQKIKSGEAE
jgi:fucose 4-O-acetylase-like acetyltransferase